MISKIELLKGIHPGVYLARELQRRELRGGTLASRIGAYRQNLNAILQGRRNMNLPLSLKIEQELDLPEGFLMTLQLHYDIARTKREQYAGQHPDRPNFRPVLFWDVDPQKIDWHKNRSFVIQRVFERGEEQEIEEAIRFYGREEILRNLRFDENPYAVNLKANARKYLEYGG